MLKKTALRTGSLAVVLMLGACSWLQQPAAPVVEGTNTGVGMQNTESSIIGGNPYGAAPYEPSASVGNMGGNAPVYTPPPTISSPSVSGSTYVPSYAPVDINAATHKVVRGDTVYNISKRYHITQDNLRAWNGLTDNNISVGQTLRVKPAGYVAPASSTVVHKPEPAPSHPPVSAPANTPPVSVVQQPAPTPPVSSAGSSGGVRTAAGITWQRPTAGNIIAHYSNSNKGVDIAGTSGQAVVSAADGKVVYAGNGLRGYGNLVIVQHNSTYLTAYGHNQALLVKEGEVVKRGQTIARMGNTDTDRVKLHFEVRQDGKPVNPVNYVAF